MKKLGFLFLAILVVLAGCNKPTQYQVETNKLKVKLKEWRGRFDVHNTKRNLLHEQEGVFIETLNDKELICYESTMEIFRNGTQPLREIARRNLQATMTTEKYKSAMEILSTKEQIYQEYARLGKELEAIKIEGEFLGELRDMRYRAMDD